MKKLIQWMQGNFGSFWEVSASSETGLEDGIKQYDFVQGVDYDLLHRIVEQVSGAKKRKDCIISIDMAKEFSIA